MQPKAYPRTPKHEQEADSVTDAVRFACDQSRFDVVRMDAAEHLFIEGVAAATVTVATLFDTFFTAVNARDYDTALAQYDPAVDP